MAIPPHGQAAHVPLPNLDHPSKTGRNDDGDHSGDELALNGFKQSPLPPNKRRKTTQGSLALFWGASLSSVPQTSSLLKRPRSPESASFVGGEVLRSDSPPLDQASPPEHALDLAFLKAEPSRLRHISPLTSHGATPNSVMPNSRDGAYSAKTLVDARQDKCINLQSMLGNPASPGIPRQHETRSSESTSTSTPLPLESSVSRSESIVRPVGDRSTRASTQLLTQRSKEWAERSQLGARGVQTYGVRSAFLKPVEEPGASLYRATADELELWTDANLSPVVFGKRKYATRLSEEELKDAVTFNLRHLLPETRALSDAERPEKRSSLTAKPEKSRKGRIAFIIQDALGLESRVPVEETDDGFSTDVPVSVNALHLLVCKTDSTLYRVTYREA